MKGQGRVNYLLVGIFPVPTTVPVPRMVLLAAAAATAACCAASRAPTAAPAATLLPRLPSFIFPVMISRLSAISRGSSRRGGWAGEVGYAGLCPQACVFSLVLSINPFCAAPCLICSLQKNSWKHYEFAACSVTFPGLSDKMLTTGFHGNRFLPAQLLAFPCQFSTMQTLGFIIGNISLPDA